jgi:hypothetical protein
MPLLAHICSSCRAIAFYLDSHPELLGDLLKVLEARIDHSRVVDIFKRTDQLPIIKDYLSSVQKNNLPAGALTLFFKCSATAVMFRNFSASRAWSCNLLKCLVASWATSALYVGRSVV